MCKTKLSIQVWHVLYGNDSGKRLCRIADMQHLWGLRISGDKDVSKLYIL